MSRSSGAGKGQSYRDLASDREKKTHNKNQKQTKKTSTSLTPALDLREAPPPVINPWHRKPSAVNGEGQSRAKAGSPHHQDPLPSEIRASKPQRNVSKEQKKKSPAVESLGNLEDKEDSPHTTNHSRADLVVAASRLPKNLWRRPFGADVLVRGQRAVFYVFRDVVVAQSEWFRNNLKPPNLDGSPVEIVSPFEDGATGTCLYFMCTRGLEYVEMDEMDPLNIDHIPRCVILYRVAIGFCVKELPSRLLRIVERTASRLRDALTELHTRSTEQRGTIQQVSQRESLYFLLRLQDALGGAYDEATQDIMKPMRLALAGLLDVSIFWLSSQPYFSGLITSETWRSHGSRISADQIEYRRHLGQCPIFTGESGTPNTFNLAQSRRWSGDTFRDETDRSTTNESSSMVTGELDL